MIINAKNVDKLQTGLNVLDAKQIQKTGDKK